MAHRKLRGDYWGGRHLYNEFVALSKYGAYVDDTLPQAIANLEAAQTAYDDAQATIAADSARIAELNEIEGTEEWTQELSDEKDALTAELQTLNNSLPSLLRTLTTRQTEKANKMPYLLISGYRFESTAVDRAQISRRAPFTVSIQLNGTGTTYSFSSGSNIKTYNSTAVQGVPGVTGTVYYVEFSSSTKIWMPYPSEEFVINTTVTTNNGETYTFTENACSPVIVSMSGPTSILTGEEVIYTISSPLLNNSETMQSDAPDVYNANTGKYVKRLSGFTSSATAYSYFPSQGYYRSASKGYVAQTVPLEEYRGEYSQFGFAVFYKGSDPGEVGNAHTDSSGDICNCISFDYWYYTCDASFGGNADQRPDRETVFNRILIAEVTLNVQITSRTEIDADLDPEFTPGDYDIAMQHRLKYGAYVQGKTTYKWRANAQPKYGVGMKSFEVYDYSSGALVYRNSTSSSVYTTLLNTAVENADMHFIYTDDVNRVFHFYEHITVLPYSAPSVPIATVERCSQVESGSGADYYTYDGTIYKLDDSGEYCLVKWGINITPLNNENSMSLKIWDPYTSDQYLAQYGTVRPTGNAWTQQTYHRTITLNGYTDSGFYVVPADGEKSYSCEFVVKDDFQKVITAVDLSTILTVMDFKGKFQKITSPVFVLDRGDSTAFGTSRTGARAFGAEARYSISNTPASNVLINGSWPGPWEASIPTLTDANPVLQFYIAYYYRSTSYNYYNGMGASRTSVKTRTQTLYNYLEYGRQISDIRFHYKLFQGSTTPDISGGGWADEIESIGIPDDNNTWKIAYYADIILIPPPSGFDGVAFGKIAELSSTFDVNRAWTIRMPNDILIGNYYGTGQNVYLSTWMENTATRIQAIADRKAWYIYAQKNANDTTTRWRSGYSGECIPSSYGTLTEEFSNTHSYIQLRCNEDRRCAFLISQAVKINRQYLHVEFKYLTTCIGVDGNTSTYHPTIYVMSTKPTTVNQSNGVPNGTVLTSKQLIGRTGKVGNSETPNCCHFLDIYYGEGDRVNNLDVSRWNGQNVYIAITCASGKSPGGQKYTGYFQINAITLSATADP